eukprot:15468558-Alexandrium_andersonii.AAC.1
MWTTLRARREMTGYIMRTTLGISTKGVVLVALRPRKQPVREVEGPTEGAAWVSRRTPVPARAA